MNETLADIGEKEILNRLKKFMDIGQIEDDTALIPINNKKVIINHDVLVEDVHFSELISSPEDVGWKAVTTNLSDLACTGVKEILGITVGLIAPPNTEWQWVEGTYRGMKEALDKYGGKIIGGDCSKGSQKILSISALGTLGPLHLNRSNAIPGDYLVTTGAHGLSRLGLALLQSESFREANLLSENLKVEAIATHKRPLPQLEALNKLIKSKPENVPWRAAGIDSSDGLLEAIRTICINSNCYAELAQEKLPVPDDWPIGTKWDNWCLNGGEDFQLIVSLPKCWAEAWVKEWPKCQIIGEIKKGLPKVIWNNGIEIKTDSFLEFNHFLKN